MSRCSERPGGLRRLEYYPVCKNKTFNGHRRGPDGKTYAGKIKIIANIERIHCCRGNSARNWEEADNFLLHHALINVDAVKRNIIRVKHHRCCCKLRGRAYADMTLFDDTRNKGR